MVTPSTITSESDVTDDGAVWSWLYQRIPEEEGLPPDKGTGASGECDALEEDIDPIKGDSAGGTPLALVTPSTITSESDVTDDGAVWSWLYQRIPEEEGLPPDKGTGASGECDALEEDIDPIKGDSARGTPLALGTGASGECDALEEDIDPIKGDSARGTPLALGTGASGECDALEEALDPIKGDSAGGTPLTMGTGASGECDALEEALDPIKGDSAGGTPLALVTPSTITSESDVTDDGAVWSWLYQRIPKEEGLPPDKGTGASGECDQAMTMATVVRKEDDFAGCEDSDP
ncbi:uncharacterized protein LOC125283080 [Ursus arctos]|uniref:uncharacterized protein LOC125283080 n=1 Tax=Ursus arctos TaxID=9644 RepID=UPI002546C707|nr:uncharacterized protein LOC125283080 [Ursus arctos]